MKSNNRKFESAVSLWEGKPQPARVRTWVYFALVMGAILLAALAANSQTTPQQTQGGQKQGQTVQVNQTTGFTLTIAKGAIPTDSIYTAASGIVYPVLRGERGGIYVIRTSGKTGNDYLDYLTTEAEKKRITIKK